MFYALFVFYTFKFDKIDSKNILQQISILN